MRYREYIESPAWKAKRATYFASHPKRCAACSGDRAIDLHHLTYERIGRELDSDLIPLCRQCHGLVHAYQRSHRCSLNEATAAVIIVFRGAQRAPDRPRAPFVPNHLRSTYVDDNGRTRVGGKPRKGKRDKRKQMNLDPEMVRKYGRYLAKQSAKRR